ALALGSAVLASFLFGLASFYLVRGRSREDLIHGMGGVLASTPVSNSVLLFARWLGAVAYLVTLLFALMVTMMVLQLVRGEAPLQPLVFVEMYGLMLIPTIFLAASVAVLCDSFSPLMGKGGDVVYFMLWIGQFSAMPSAIEKHSERLGALGAVDISGIAVIAQRLKQLYHTEHFSIGSSPFDPTLAPIIFADFWTADMAGMRIMCALLAMLPLLPAVAIFHRFSPDRVKNVGTARRFSIWALINRLFQPATRLVRPLLSLAARLPGIAGQAMADLALTLMSNPVAVVALIGVSIASAVASANGLAGVLAFAIACWGILISDLSVRDFQSATESLTAAVNGGASRRYLRHMLVTALLGLLFSAVVLTRWVAINPLGAGALVTGIFALSACASLLGRSTRTGKTFLALFLFGLYFSLQIKDIPWLDIIGANGSATVTSVSAQLVAALVMCAVGYEANRRLKA
ncbi:MAG: hypothetical protein LH481_03015, partial [Burkholderiales bacterium]|nr:hypothetical protein [Burkholderiales bacterium]